MTPENFDVLEAQLNRISKLFNGLTVTVNDALDLLAELK